METQPGIAEVLAGANGRLATLPGVAVRLLEVIQGPHPEVQEIAAVLATDPALSAEVLRLVNSSLYGLSRPITTVRHAATYLGLNTVANLALGFAVIRSFGGNGGVVFDYRRFWQHSLLTAMAGRQLGTQLAAEQAEDDFCRGLLHDIGALALAQGWPARYTQVRQIMRERAWPDFEAEAQVFGCDHMTVGSRLVEDWNLPAAFSVPIAHHHHPHRLPAAGHEHATATRILSLAGGIARMLGAAVDPRVEWEALEEALEDWGWRERVDLGAVAAAAAGQAREVLPLFDLELDVEGHLALAEAARQELARRALEALEQVHGQRREIDRLSQRINRDGMTQLLNHAFFQDLLAQEMDRCRCTRRPMALILADIDHFKAVNDTYGHLAGDRVIQAVADCLRGSLRQDDHIARYGGEEFAIVLLDTPPSRAREVGERLRRSVSDMSHKGGGGNFAVTMSFGLALFRGEPDLAPENLLERADNALYRAKAEGRNCLRSFTATPD